MKRIAVATLCVALVLVFSACQKTPESVAVINKGESQPARQSATPSSSNPTAQETEWALDKEYDNGAKLHIDADVKALPSDQYFVGRLNAKPFTADDARSITSRMLEGQPAYEYTVTKERIMAQLSELRELQARFTADPDSMYLDSGEPAYGFVYSEKVAPATEEERNAIRTPLDELQLMIRDLEMDYETAPSIQDLPEADFTFISQEDSEQICVAGPPATDWPMIAFANWTGPETGSTFLYELDGQRDGWETYLYENMDPAKLEASEYSASLAAARGALENLGVDYMDLRWISSGENRTGHRDHTFCFTRTANGIPETHAPTFIGTAATNIDYETAQERPLWRPEDILITVRDNNIVTDIKWNNPSTLEMSNEHVDVLPFETAKEAALQQLDRILGVKTEEELELDALYDVPDREVTINSIELGMVKVIVPNTDEYELIPAWTFLGYEESDLYHEAQQTGKMKAFVTINALDGSVIDRGLMY